MSEKCHCGLCVHLGQPLLERLRGHVGTAWINEDEAADRIEQLEAENQKLRDTNQRLRERIDQLETPQWYWDDRCLDSAIEPHEIGDYDDVGDIIELRPIHELPKVFVLITHTGPRLFDSREAAESEVSDESE